jgi:TPR repeat protein
MSAVMHSVATKELANNTYEQAERSRATSFQSLNVAECIKTNQDAVELLKQAINMGSLKARACLADMLLNGTTAGIGVDWVLFNRLLSGDVANMGPDCEGVLAHYHFKRGYYFRANQGKIHDAATRSAAAGSKYGQFVVGSIELFEKKPELAFAQFNLAAQQNYDQAQIVLGELHLRANPPDQVEALRLFKLAADQGNIHAFQLIANTHKKNALERHDVNDYREAIQWFTFCKEAGCLLAQNDLMELNADMKLHELHELQEN